MFTASSPAPTLIVRRFFFFTEPAATKTIYCRSGARLRTERALLSPRGNVLEGDMPRFFKRYREGVFDEDDVRRRANELAHFVAEARRAYGLARPVALGYSNGANIAAAVLLLHPKTLAGAILLRATTPLAEPPRPDLSGIPVMILSGLNDPIIPRSGAEKLAKTLAARGRGSNASNCPPAMALRRPTWSAPRRSSPGKRRTRFAPRLEPPLGRHQSALATNLTMSVMTVEAT